MLPPRSQKRQESIKEGGRVGGAKSNEAPFKGERVEKHEAERGAWAAHKKRNGFHCEKEKVAERRSRRVGSALTHLCIVLLSPSSSSVMQCFSEMLTFRRGDLFEATSALGHCISKDIKMSRGIALEFRNRFGGIQELLDQGPQVGGIVTLRRGRQVIYYLVTKSRFFQKPSIQTLRSSLLAMRRHMLAHGIPTVALPRVGAGIDRLPWPEVEGVLYEIFGNSQVNAIVHIWEG